MGKAIPESLRSVGYPVTRIGRIGLLGKPDTRLLTVAGDKGWLVLSKNKRMLLVPEERQVIIDKKLGIVFLTQDIQDLPRLLRLLLRKWDWICEQDTKPRPFAMFLSPDGRTSDRHTDKRRRYYSLLPPK